MKILFTGTDKQLLKGFQRYMPGGYTVNISGGEAESGKYEYADAEFKNQGYDAVVFVSLDSGGGENSIGAAELVAFKNIQYAAILHGVKKLIAVVDASELGEDAIDAAEPFDGDSELLNCGHSKSRLICTLALKDKISTVLRVFEIYGKGIKGGISDILNAPTGKKVFKLTRDKTVSAVYIEDAARILTEFLEGDLPKGDYNLTPDIKVSYTEAAKKLRSAAKKLGKEFNFTLIDNESAQECSGSNAKLREALPVVKFTSLQSAATKILRPEPKAKKAKAKPKAKKTTKSAKRKLIK